MVVSRGGRASTRFGEDVDCFSVNVDRCGFNWQRRIGKAWGWSLRCVTGHKLINCSYIAKGVGWIKTCRQPVQRRQTLVDPILNIDAPKRLVCTTYISNIKPFNARKHCCAVDWSRGSRREVRNCPSSYRRIVFRLFRRYAPRSK